MKTLILLAAAALLCSCNDREVIEPVPEIRDTDRIIEKPVNVAVTPVPGTIAKPTETPYSRLIKKGHPWSWVWQYQGSPVADKVDIHVLDGFDHSPLEFKSVVDKGAFPVAYFSCSYENGRPDSKFWRESDKGSKMSGWDELWPNPNAIKDHNSNLWNIYRLRLVYLRDKLKPVTGGIPDSVGVEWDNVDLYDSIRLGQPEGLRFLQHLKKITEDAGFVFALKNSVEMVPHLEGVKLYVNEEAQQWNEIGAYSKVGYQVPVLNVEYKRPKSSPPYVYTLYYSNTSNINGRAIVIK